MDNSKLTVALFMDSNLECGHTEEQLNSLF